MPSAGTWYTIELLPLSDAAYDTPFPTLPGPVLGAVKSGATMMVYCLAEDGTDATFTGLDEGVFQIPIACIDTETPETTTTTTMVDGGKWIGTRYVVDGSYRYYDDQIARVRVMPSVARTALAAILT